MAPYPHLRGHIQAVTSYIHVTSVEDRGSKVYRFYFDDTVTAVSPTTPPLLSVLQVIDPPDALTGSYVSHGTNYIDMDFGSPLGPDTPTGWQISGANDTEITFASGHLLAFPQSGSITGSTPTLTIGLSPITISRSILQGQTLAPDSFYLYNAGAGTLNFSISDDATWLICLPHLGNAGNPGRFINIAYTTGPLAPGTYTGTITITAAGASNTPQTVVVTLTVSAPPTHQVVSAFVNDPTDDTGNGDIQSAGGEAGGGLGIEFNVATDATPTDGSPAAWAAGIQVLDHDGITWHPGTFFATYGKVNVFEFGVPLDSSPGVLTLWRTVAPANNLTFTEDGRALQTGQLGQILLNRPSSGLDSFTLDSDVLG